MRSGQLAGCGVRKPRSVSDAKACSEDCSTKQSAIAKSCGRGPERRPRTATAVPDSILFDEALNADIGALPKNYSFEVHKTVHRIRSIHARRVALQLPEGLLMYANVLADIIKTHCSNAETIVLGDVTFGACCVDDLSAAALGADLLVHYGHSCLVPVQTCCLPMLYIFVHIGFDPSHFLRCLKGEFRANTRIALVGTIQFVDTIHSIRDDLARMFGAENVQIPQARPLSPGELLGCTSPRFSDIDALVYIGDGRFHLESAMIANPNVPAYRYDPYWKSFSIEEYSYDDMVSQRRDAITRASKSERIGIILGTLGRQGSPKILERVRSVIDKSGKQCVIVLLSEITPNKLERMERSGVIDAWVQIACPRLSIDWGSGFCSKPLLTPYELYVAVGATEWRQQYPMDFYSKNSGEWGNYYKNETRTTEDRSVFQQKRIEG